MKRTFGAKRRLRNGNAALSVGLGLATLCGVATFSPQVASAQEVETVANETADAPKISPEEAEKLQKELDEVLAARRRATDSREYENAVRYCRRACELTLRLEAADALWRDFYATKRVKKSGDSSLRITEYVPDKEAEKKKDESKRFRTMVGPGKTALLKDLGDAYAFCGDWEKAEEAYRDAGCFEPEKAKFYLWAKPRAQVAFARGRFDEAFDVVCASTKSMREGIEHFKKARSPKDLEARKKYGITELTYRSELWREWAEIAKPVNFSKPGVLPSNAAELAGEGKLEEGIKAGKARYDEIMKTFPETPDERFAVLRANYDELMEKVVEPEFKRRGEPEEFRAEVELLREIAATQAELADEHFKRFGEKGLTQAAKKGKTQIK